MESDLSQKINMGMNLVDLGLVNALFTIDAIHVMTATLFHVFYIILGVFFGVGIIPFERVYWVTALILYFVIGIIIGSYRSYMVKYSNTRKKDFYIASCATITSEYVKSNDINPMSIRSLVESEVMPVSRLLYTEANITAIVKGVQDILNKPESI